jgi:hypothetical protein
MSIFPGKRSADFRADWLNQWPDEPDQVDDDDQPLYITTMRAENGELVVEETTIRRFPLTGTSERSCSANPHG